MKLLDGTKVACFDLFDTLIRIRTERLPEAEFGDTRIRSTIPILYEDILARHGVTLPDFQLALRTVWTQVRAELRQSEGSEDERYREMTATEKYRRMLRNLSAIAPDQIEGLAQEIAELHHGCLVDAAEAIEGAREVLSEVRAREIPTVLISNWDYAPAGEAMLKATGLAELLDHVVISDAVGLRKPHSKLFERALEPFESSPSAALHVGDLAKADAWGAGRLGFRTVWIDRRSEGWPAELEHPPTLQVERISELLGYL